MAEAKGKERISAIIACYRDEPAIPLMHQRLTKTFQDLGVDYEIIFVNDGSPDESAAMLAELAARDPRVVAINHTRNFGSQSAFSSGMAVATGDAVVLLDGDLQDPPELIPEFVAKWREGYTVVYGVRVQREASRFLQFGYKAFYRLFRAASYVAVPVDAGDFSLIDRIAVDALNRLPEKHRFLRGLRAWIGYKQIGVPYVRPERAFGRSTNSMLKNLGWARRAIISFSFLPLDAIMGLAFFIVLLSVVAAIMVIVARLLAPSIAPTGITTVIVLILFLGGIQLLCLGIIGSYLAHIYEEVKQRPSYLVKEILNDPRGKPRD